MLRKRGTVFLFTVYVYSTKKSSEVGVNMELWIRVVSILFAFLAAGLWGFSAFVPVPILRSGYGTLVAVMKDGTQVPNELPFYAALKKISCLNAAAAACAGFSASAQAVALLLGY